jgi:hypothetical protein
MKKTYHGSCHCGAVAYEADIDLAEGTLKCNCSICAKDRFWQVAVKAEAFRLLRGEDALTEYLFNWRKNHHLFCRTCGTHSFGWAEDDERGDRFYAVKLSTLDDVDVAELTNAPVIHVDGRNDDFTQAPAETRHL